MHIFLTRLSSSDILRGFVSTAVWSGLSKFFVLGVTFYCSNTLTQEGFGEYSFVKNTLNVLLTICAVNFSSLASKFATESLRSVVSLKRMYILFIFVVSVGFIFGVLLLATPLHIVKSFTGAESIAYFVKLMGALLPIFIIQPVVAAVFRGYKEFNRVGRYEAAMSLLYLLLTVLGIRFLGYRGAIYAIMTYYVINSIVGVWLLYMFNHSVGYIKKVDEIGSERSVLWIMVLPLFIMSFIEVPLTWIAQAEIGRRASYAMVGGLSVIMSIRYIIQILPTYFYQAFVPYAAQLFASGMHDEYFEKYRKIIKVETLLQFILIPLLMFFGRFLLSLYGASYVSYYSSFIVSLVSIPLLLYGALFKVNMMIREHQRIMLKMSVYSGLIFILCFYLFVFLHINPIDSFLWAQLLQYVVQLLYGIMSYLRDKNNVAKSMIS